MKVIFRRTGTQSYASTAYRTDRVVLSIPGPDRPKFLPHDLGHLIIEQALGLESGFWGKLSRGAIYDGVQIVSGRQKPHPKAQSQAIFKADNQRGTQAEELVSVILKLAEKRDDENWTVAKAVLAEMWAPPKAQRIELTERQLREICELIRAAAAQWQNLPIEGTLEYQWLQPSHSGSQSSARS